MAISNLTGLWQLAATMMGERGTLKVTDATTPATPLELTFDALYDQVRLSMLKRGNWEFATRHQALELAPTVDWEGRTRVWQAANDRQWNYVYAPPLNSVKFLGFDEDIPEKRLFYDRLLKNLPINYAAATLTSIGGGEFQTSDIGSYTFRDWGFCQFTDESGEKHRVTIGEGTTAFNFVTIDEETETAIPGSTATFSYFNPGQVDFDLSVGHAAGIYDFATSSWPLVGQMSFIYAYGEIGEVASLTSQKNEHILTDLDNATGRFLVDVTDPSEWPSHFQDLVASELARRASVVHSKSEKTVNRLTNEVAFHMTEAISELTADDGLIEDGPMSGAEKARL